MSRPAPALATTLHDPDARLTPLLAAALPALRERFAGVYAVGTADTVPATLDRLRQIGAEVETQPAGQIGLGRRACLALARAVGAAPLLYCDLDRVLHWLDKRPAELDAVLAELPGHDLLVLGRTPRAFSTHPRVQVETERLTNHVFALGYGQALDITAGARGLSAHAADWLIARSRETTCATDAEWPFIVRRLGGQVAELGYAAWEAAPFETVAAWQHRLRLVAQAVTAVAREQTSNST